LSKRCPSRVRRLVRALVEGRLVVGAAAAAIGAATASILGISMSPALGVVLFAATVLIYDLDEILDRRGGPRRVPRVVLGTALGAGGLLAMALPYLQTETILLVAAGMPACVLYAVPLPLLGGARIKDHPVGKAAYVAAAVTSATVVLPCLEAGVFPGAVRLGAAATWAFVAILGNAVACDLRDRERDLRSGRRSLAIVWGADATSRGLGTASLVALGIGVVAMARGLVPAGVLLPLAATPLVLRGLGGGAPAWAWGLALDGVFLPLFLLL